MQWHDLLFLHWPVPADWLRPHIPSALELETFDGMAWLGIVPFYMKGTRPRFLPAIPYFSDFPELNVRTYVTSEGKPGVWFFSLDVTNPLAVRGARLAFHLPYFDAEMTVQREGETVNYKSKRTHKGKRDEAADFVSRYRPIGPVYNAQSGSLDHWLTERYCLYSANERGCVFRADIHHKPWPLQPATATLGRNTMTSPLGFSLPDVRPVAHFAQRQDVIAWFIQQVDMRDSD